MEGEIDLDDQISARGKRRNNKTFILHLKLTEVEDCLAQVISLQLEHQWTDQQLSRVATTESIDRAEQILEQLGQLCIKQFFRKIKQYED